MNAIQPDLFESAWPARWRRGEHPNSRAALAEDSRDLSRRALAVLRWFLHQSVARTDRECKDAMFGEHADMNTVRPRITELIEAGVLEECGVAPCRITGKRVRLCRPAVGNEIGCAGRIAR